MWRKMPLSTDLLTFPEDILDEKLDVEKIIFLRSADQ